MYCSGSQKRQGTGPGAGWTQCGRKADLEPVGLGWNQIQALGPTPSPVTGANGTCLLEQTRSSEVCVEGIEDAQHSAWQNRAFKVIAIAASL